jgi:hypothetical protein
MESFFERRDRCRQTNPHKEAGEGLGQVLQKWRLQPAAGTQGTGKNLKVEERHEAIREEIALPELFAGESSSLMARHPGPRGLTAKACRGRRGDSAPARKKLAWEAAFRNP